MVTTSMGSGQTGEILCFATQGGAHLDAVRLRALLAPWHADELEFDRAHRLRSAIALARAIAARPRRLVVMEGTGMAGGLILIAASLVLGTPYVVDSGDAVGPYLRLRSRAAGLLGAAYERLLCRRCTGFIGWTPYLVGRALTLGAPLAISVPGWPRERSGGRTREQVRAELGIAPDALVIGLVGSLNWRESVGYVYGAELVRAIAHTERRDVVACVVGDGSGRARLQELAGEELGRRVILPGAVAPDEVDDYLGAFDLASLPQSVDGVGSFRYSTKLAGYLRAGLPVVSGRIPAAYDLDGGFFWRLPGEAPWSERYVLALAALLDSVTPEQVRERGAAAAAHAGGETFDRDLQLARARAFIGDLLEAAA